MFFCEKVTVTGARVGRSIAAPIAACVVDDGAGDPLAETSSASECANICVYFKISEWPEIVPPQIGDAVVRFADRRYAVKRVGHLGDCYCLSCRDS